MMSEFLFIYLWLFFFRASTHSNHCYWFDSLCHIAFHSLTELFCFVSAFMGSSNWLTIHCHKTETRETQTTTDNIVQGCKSSGKVNLIAWWLLDRHQNEWRFTTVPECTSIKRMRNTPLVTRWLHIYRLVENCQMWWCFHQFSCFCVAGRRPNVTDAISVLNAKMEKLKVF